MRQRVAKLGACIAIAVAGASTAHAQTTDVTVAPDTTAPGGIVTVSVIGATPGDAVVVELGTEETTGTVDGTGAATVTIAAPTQAGEAVGTVSVGDDDFSIRVVVQDDTATTTTTTTLPTPTSEPPVTGIDDAGTIAIIGAVLALAGIGLLYFTRRPPTAATTTRGGTTDYRLVGRRRR